MGAFLIMFLIMFLIIFRSRLELDPPAWQADMLSPNTNGIYINMLTIFYPSPKEESCIMDADYWNRTN
jgi:hypothetical protein